MIESKIIITDLFVPIVAKTNTRVNAVRPVGDRYDILYLAASVEEINATLVKMSNSNTQSGKRYPAILLFQPIKEVANLDSIELPDLRFLIAMNTLPNLSREERKIQSFVPFLNPIRDAFLHEISRSTKFRECSVWAIKKEEVDWPFFSENEQKNLFDEFIDCIELKIKLNVKR